MHFEQAEPLYTMKDAGAMLGLPPDAVSKIVDRKQMPTVRRRLAGKGRWVTLGQVEQIAEGLGIDVRPLTPA